MDLPSLDDLLQIERDVVLAANGNLSRDVVEREGTDANILLSAAAAAAEEVCYQLTLVAAGLYLDSADSIALSKLVFDRYGLVRKPAAAAQVTVNFSTTAPSPTQFTIPKGTQLQTAAGLQFLTVADAIYLQGSTGPLAVVARSSLAGSNQAAKAGLISNITGQVPGSPSDLAVTNPLATFGADNAETDASLRDRARRFFTTARRGTAAAIVAGALAVPGVRTAQLIEVLDTFGRPAKSAQLLITDAFTDAFVRYDTIPASYQLQSNALAAQVFAALVDVRAAGIFINVIVAATVVQPIVMQLSFLAGVDTDAVTAQCKAAAVNYVNQLAPGAPLRYDDLKNAVESVQGLDITGQEILSPQGDVVPQPLQVLRASLNLVTTSA